MERNDSNVSSNSYKNSHSLSADMDQFSSTGRKRDVINDEDSEEMDLEWEEWDPSRLSFVDHMLAGSFAGLAEHVSIFPMDTLKTNMQCNRCDKNQGRPFQTLKCAKRIVKQSGVMRLWRGVSAMFAGCIPAHAAYFSLFESMKVALGADQQGHYPLRAAACGASATLVHDLMMTPFDVVKQRMQLGYHHNVLSCARTILRTEGARAFYLSFPTTVAMNLPYGCVMVAVNESSRKFILDCMRPPPCSPAVSNPPHSRAQRLSASMLSGGVAGAVAALLTTPLDVVKTRLQTQNLVSQTLRGTVSKSPVVASPLPLACPGFSPSNSGNGAVQATRHMASAAAPPGTMATSSGDPAVSRRYLTMRQTFRCVVREEGYVALLTGAVPRILVHAPSVAVSWTAYEFAKSLLADFRQ